MNKVAWNKAKKPLKWAGALGILVLVAGGIVGYRIWSHTPDFSQLRRSVKVDIRLASGQESQRWVGPNAPGWVPLSDASNYLLTAFISSEDTSFFQHEGVDFHEIGEAIKKDLKEKRFARGASTITQQVVKNVYLSHEKTLWRKFREVIWASRMEDVLTKQQILAFYINMVELGPGIYGVRHAAQYYFGKQPSELGPRESAFLAMLLPSPRRYHEYFEKKELSEWAEGRVNRILEVMHNMGFLGEVEYRMGLEEELWPEAGPDEGLEDEQAPAQFPDVLPDSTEPTIAPDTSEAAPSEEASPPAFSEDGEERPAAPDAGQEESSAPDALPPAEQF